MPIYGNKKYLANAWYEERKKLLEGRIVTRAGVHREGFGIDQVQNMSCVDPGITGCHHVLADCMISNHTL